MRRLILSLIVLLISTSAFAQKFGAQFGIPVNHNTEYYFGNSSTTSFTPLPPGNTGMNWADFIKKGAILTETRISPTEIRQTLIRMSATMGDWGHGYWAIAKDIPVSNSDIITPNSQTDFSYWSIYKKSFINYVPDLDSYATNNPKRVNVTLDETYRISYNNGQTWSETINGDYVTITLQAKSTDFLKNLPTAFKSTDAKYKFTKKDGVYSWMGDETLSGPIDFEFYDGGYFNPANAVIGPNLIVYTASYINGNFTDSKVVDVCNAAPSIPTLSATKLSICNGESVTITATGTNLVWNNGATGNSIVITSPGMYSCHSTNACGTSNDASITISTSPQPNPPVISASGTTNLCNGATVTLTATGSNITWSNGASGNSINVSTPGNYLAYENNGCGQSAPSNNITVTNSVSPDAPVISANGSTDLCNGATVTLTATGSNVSWSNGQTGNAITVSGAGTYYAYDNNSCGQSAPSNGITVNSAITPSAPSIAANGSTNLCIGATVTLTATGNNVTWNTGQTGNSIIVSTAGTYYAYDNSSCGQSGPSNGLSITTEGLPEPPVVTASGSTHLCDGASVTFTATGENVSWSTGQSGNSITVTTPGLIWAKSQNSCHTSILSNTFMVTVGNKPEAPTISTNTTMLCPGEVAHITATGTNITWSNGAKGNFIVVESGTYYAYSENDCGLSIASNAITISQESILKTPQIEAHGSTTLCNGATVTLTATGTGIIWSTGETGNQIVVSTDGNYYAYAQNNCGKSPISNNIIVTANTTPSKPIITVVGDLNMCDGKPVQLSAVGTNLVWSNGEIGNTITVTNPGTYSVTSTGICGNATSDPVIVKYDMISPPNLVSGNLSICSGQPTTIEVIGENVTWSNGATGNIVTFTTPGTYYAYSNSSCGQSAGAMFEITEDYPLGTATIIIRSGKKNLCGTERVILTTTSGSNNVEWYKNGSLYMLGRDFSTKDPGQYTAIVSNGCGRSQMSEPFIITKIAIAPAPIISASGSTNLCNGESVVLTATGSDITWNNGAVGNSITVATPGTYYAFDNSGCSISPASNSIVVNTSITPQPPIVTASGSTDLCNGATVTLNATGSNIVWSNGATGNSIIVSDQGQYYAYDTNSCGQSPASNSINVSSSNIPDAPLITSGGSTSLCNGATVILTSTGSNVIWNNGATGNSITVSSAGQYFAFDQNSCGQSAASNIITVQTSSVPTPPVVTASGTTNLCNGATVSLTASGSNITWSNGAIGNTIIVSDAGQYYAYDQNACGQSNSSNTITVTQSSVSTPIITSSATIIFNNENITISSNAGAVEWFKNNTLVGSTTDNLITNSPGTYKARSINSNGCVSEYSNEITITKYLDPVVIIPPTDPEVEIIDNPDGSTTIKFCKGKTVVLTAPEADSYQWFKNGTTIPGANSKTLQVNQEGDYTVQITKSQNAYITKKLTVILFSLPNKPIINY